MVPYSTGMDINPRLTGIRSRQSHKVSWLRTVFIKYGCQWPDILVKAGNLHIADVENGDVLISAVLPVDQLVRIIEKVDGALPSVKHRASERLLEDLVQIKTEKVLILIPAGSFDYTNLDVSALHREISEMRNALSDSIPMDGFVPYDPTLLKRGTVLQLDDGRRAVAFNGFHLAGEPVEPAMPIQAMLIDGSIQEDTRNAIIWVISDTGMLADRTRARIHPLYACSSDVIDRILFCFKCSYIVDNNAASEKTFTMDEAFILAAELYKGIRDFAGDPYILHVFKVVDRVKTTNERICAILHDVLTVRQDITVNILFDKGVPLSILQALVVLTQNPDENYTDYIRRVKLNPLATKVKKACLMHDMDISRIKGKPTEEDFSRKYLYQKAYTLLSSK